MSGDKVEIFEPGLLLQRQRGEIIWRGKDGLLGGKRRVKIADVGRPSQRRHEGGLDSPGKEGTPVELLENKRWVGKSVE